MLAGAARSPRNRQCWWSSTTLKDSTWHVRPDLPAGLLGGGTTRIRGATLRCGSPGSPWRPTGAWWWRAFCCGRSTIPPRTSAAPCSRGWVGGAYPTVGAVIVARRPRNPVGWLCCAVGLLLGPAFFGQDYAWYALVREAGSLPGGQVMAWLGQWPWRVVLGLLSFLLLLFPSGRLVSARWRPVAWAAAAGTVLYAAVLSVLVWLLLIVTGVADRLPAALGIPVLLVWLVAVPAAIGVAMLRYRLYDIDRLINRTVVYGLLTALLGGGYAGLVLMLGQLFGRSSSLAVAAATLTIAAAFQPARRRIQHAVDRRFNRRRYDAARTIAAFSARLREEIDLDSLSAELLGVVDQTMEPTNATLWLRPSPDRMVEPLNRPAAGSTA